MKNCHDKKKKTWKEWIPHGWDIYRWAAGKSWCYPHPTATPGAGYKLKAVSKLKIGLLSPCKDASTGCMKLTFAHDTGELTRQIPFSDETGTGLGLTSAPSRKARVGPRALVLWTLKGALQRGLFPSTEGPNGGHGHLVELLKGGA